MTLDTTDGLFDIKTAAEYLHLTPGTLRYHMRLGHLGFRKISSRIYFTQGDLDRMITIKQPNDPDYIN